MGGVDWIWYKYTAKLGVQTVDIAIYKKVSSTHQPPSPHSWGN